MLSVAITELEEELGWKIKTSDFKVIGIEVSYNHEKQTIQMTNYFFLETEIEEIKDLSITDDGEKAHLVNA